MALVKLKFRVHRTLIILICLALLVALMQGASWFSQSHRQTRNVLFEELAKTLAVQVSYSLTPMLKGDTPDEKHITALLRNLTQQSRILDASVYDEQGSLIAKAGENVNVRDRLALDGKKPEATLTSKSCNPSKIKEICWVMCA